MVLAGILVGNEILIFPRIISVDQTKVCQRVVVNYPKQDLALVPSYLRERPLKPKLEGDVKLRMQRIDLTTHHGCSK